MSAPADVELHLPRHVLVAPGAAARLAGVTAACGVARPLVVTDRFLAEHGPVTWLVAALAAAGLEPALYPDVHPDPTVADVEGGLAALGAHRADGLVAIGGGSAIDAAKAIAMMAANPGTVGDYAGRGRLGAAGPPVVAVPTTAGTGSEVTRVTVITDVATTTKMMILDDRLLCAAAVVDAELSASCPPALTAHVGVDALTHAIEAYVSPLASPATDLWALEAVRLIGAHLRTAFAVPGDREARAAMALGATLAGLAFSNASVGLVHGMSRPLGARFHLPHGLSNAVLLPAVTRFALAAAPERFGRIARTLGAAAPDAADHAATEALVPALAALNRDLGVPTLRGLGVERAALDAAAPAMARAALESGSPASSPRVASAREIVDLYAHAF